MANSDASRGASYADMGRLRLSRHLGAIAKRDHQQLGYVREVMPGRLDVMANVVVREGGRIDIDALSIEVIGARGLTSSDLRSVSLDRLLRAATKEAADEAGRERISDLTPAVLDRVKGAQGPARGRPRLSDALLAEVAEAYLEEYHSAKGRGLRRRMAARLNRPEETVRDWVAAARRAGYLTPAQPGVRGASAGPRLVAHRQEGSPS